jgi:hypothetical protein
VLGIPDTQGAIWLPRLEALAEILTSRDKPKPAA